MPRVEIAETVLQTLAGGQLRAVSGASVQVNIRGAGAATVYALAAGAGVLANPLTSVNGNLVGWVEPGSYDLVVTYEGVSYTSYLEAVDAELIQVDPAQRSSNAAGGAHATHATPNTYKTVVVLNATRREIEVRNDSDTVAFLRLGGVGIVRLAPNGGSWYSAQFTGLVESFCEASAKSLTVYELLA